MLDKCSVPTDIWWSWVWRDGSTVKSAYVSSFPAHIVGSSQQPVTSAPGDPVPSSGLSGHLDTHSICSCRHTYVPINKIKYLETETYGKVSAKNIECLKRFPENFLSHRTLCVNSCSS